MSLRKLLPQRSSSLRSSLPPSDSPPFRLPETFLWGTATAAYQIEHTQDDDWAAFEAAVMKEGRFGTLGPGKAKPGHIHNLGSWPEDVRRKKTDFDARIDEDLAMAASMGHNAYRFSISWARLFPREDQRDPDPAGVAFYRRIFDILQERKMTPVVTLFHFTSPRWLWRVVDGKSGWERADALQHWERFVRAVLQHFGGRMPIVCTLNEPMVYVYAGYLDGVFPPLERRVGPSDVVPVIEQLLRAHARAYHLIKEDAARRGQQVQVGYAQHTRVFEPLRSGSLLDRLTAGLITRAFIWDFCDAVETGTLRLTGTSSKGQHEIPGLRGSQDYLGINYYGRFYVRSHLLRPTKFDVLLHDPAARQADYPNDLGWASYPRGFRQVLNDAGQRYRLPVYVLENGTADAASDDRLRQRLLVEHVFEMWQAMRDGTDVRGYFHWSLFDNFEWAEGFEARFGLVAVDYRDGFRRTPRPSAELYRRIIESRGLDADLVDAWLRG
ncbi:MAG: glycoside hydrolase family 1 protein [Myxococcales bacterium]|nr:glycoside hydrolase family 1 protein [Myxococcales bacterium]